MTSIWTLLLLVSFTACSWSLKMDGSMSSVDLVKLAETLESSLKGITDLETAHYGIEALKIIEKYVKSESSMVKKHQGLCNSLAKPAADSMADSFYATSLASSLGCKSEGNAVSSAKAALTTKGATPENLFFASAILAVKNEKIDVKALVSALQDGIKDNDALPSYGYAFHALANAKPKTVKEIQGVWDLIEDVVAWSDVVDNRIAQYDSGLHTTGIILSGIYNLAGVVNTAPKVSDTKIIQFSNYFLSRKATKKPQNIYILLSAMQHISENKFALPGVVSFVGGNVASEQNPTTYMKVSDILGRPIKGVSMTVESGKHIRQGVTVMSSQALKEDPSQPGNFALSMMESKPPSGSYNLVLKVKVASQPAKVVGLDSLNMVVKVATSAMISNAKLTVADRDGSDQKHHTATYPNKVSSTQISVDFHQKISFDFTIMDQRQNQPITVHQAFVRFSHETTGQEIIFIAEPVSATEPRYHFDMSIAGKAKEFGSVSGKYNLELIIGDSSLSTPMRWLVSQMSIEFPYANSAPNTFADEFTRKALPEIAHTFQVPEQRPPAIVSLVFTGLVLAPIPVLLILWLAIGININNLFVGGISGICFHVCLAAIFALYAQYFFYLNMFDVLKRLAMLSIPTAFFGKRLLSAISAAKMKKGF